MSIPEIIFKMIEVKKIKNEKNKVKKMVAVF